MVHASPERVTLKCRAANKSAKARALRKVTANQAAALYFNGVLPRKELELKDFRVTSRATPEDIEQFRNVIDNARDEKPIQTFLENNPQVLAALFGRSIRA